MKTSDKTRITQDRAAQLEREDWEWFLNDVRGLRVLYRMIARCGVFSCQMQPNALTSAFMEGQRNQGIYLWDRLARFAPEKIPEFLQMRLNDDGR